LAAGTRIWIVAGVTDMRRGFVGLSGMVQTALKENPFSGQVFVFRGKRGDLIKLLWWDGDGLCLFAKRLERIGALYAIEKEIRGRPPEQRREVRNERARPLRNR